MLSSFRYEICCREKQAEQRQENPVQFSVTMDISIIGSGFVGLITALGFALKGHHVVCIDIDRSKVDMINRGCPPFFQQELEDALSGQVNGGGNLRASTNYDELLHSDMTFVCVNTSSDSGVNADSHPIETSSRTIGETLRRKPGYHLVAIKSSVTPGTTEHLVIPTLQKYSGKRAGEDLGIAVTPEFLQEGCSLHGLLNPDRIIIGQHDMASGDFVQHAYNGSQSPILRTDLKTAEMIKFASNAFLATKISFINEIGNLCKKLGIDTYEVAHGMGYDPRIGRLFLNAGIGFGGSCLPRDLDALIRKSEEMGEPSTVLNAVCQTNKAQVERMIQASKRIMGGLNGKAIAVLGLAFKPDTDDIRNAPSLQVIRQLLAHGARVVVYDPKAMPKLHEEVHEGISFADSAAQAIQQSDCVLIVTEWPEFKDEDLYSGKIVIDGRRALNPEKARGVCSHYEGVCW